MATNQLAFPVIAIDEASRTFERIAKSVEGLNRRLDRLEARKAAEIKLSPSAERVDKDEKSISKLSGTLSHITGVLGKLGKVGLKGGGFAVMAAGAAAAAAQVAHLAAALAPAAGILAGLPALIAVRGAAMATFAVGLAGIQDAIGSAFTDDAKKFEESIAKLGPSAQKTMRALRELVPWFEATKRSVQDSLFKDLDVQLKKVSDSLLGPMHSGMKSVATEANLVIQGMAGVATEGATVSLVDGAFSTLAGIIAQCREPLVRLAQAFVAVANAGMGSIGQLGSGVAGLIDKFASWLKTAAETGKIQEWISGAVTVFKQLWDVASPLVGILTSIGSAASASGGNLLGTVGQLLSVVDAFLKTADGQAFLDSLFKALGVIGEALGPVIAAIGTGLAGVLPYVGQIGAALGPGLTALITGLGDGLAALAPAMVPIATAISDIAVAAAPILPIIGKVAAVVATLIGRLLGAIDIGKIFDAVEPAITAILPSLETFGGILGDIGSAVLTELAGALSELLPKVADLAKMMIDKMLPVWESMGSKIIDLIPLIFDLALTCANLMLPILEQLLPVWMELQTTLAGGVIDAVLALVPAITSIVTAATPLIEIVVSLAAILLTLLSGALSWVIGLVVGLVDIVADLVVGIIDMTQPIRDAASALKEKLGDAVEWVQDKMDEALQWWGDLGTNIKEAVGDLGETLKQAGKDLLQGLMDGIQSNVPQLEALFSGITGHIPQWKGPPATDRKLLTPSGQMIMSGLMDGISTQVPALRAQLGGITGIVPGAVPSAAVAAGLSGAMPIGQGTAPMELVIRLVGDDEADLRRLRSNIEARGGLRVVFGE